MKLKIKNWHNLPWLFIMNKVRDLQDQIVKATMNNDMRTVYNLQRRLVISFEGRALAIRKVVTNSGAKSTGIDEII
jgi:RNA-directed DNA polymerase